jgi:hypothetical protein
MLVMMSKLSSQSATSLTLLKVGVWRMINGTSSEPSTWAMMILGFCRVDFSAYRQKRNGAAYKQPLFISRVAALATSMILMAWGDQKRRLHKTLT